MNTYDVVVVGAGLSGLHAARLAARRGLSVLLVDRKARLDAGIHTTGIFVRRTLEDFALPDGCLGPPVRCVRLLGPSLHGVTLESHRDEFRNGLSTVLCTKLGVTLLIVRRPPSPSSSESRKYGLRCTSSGA